MPTHVTASTLMASVAKLRNSVCAAWGQSWKTELLDRLTDESRMTTAWAELAKRTSEPQIEETDSSLSMTALCFLLWDIREAAEANLQSPKDQSDASRAIANKAQALAREISDHPLDRIADPYLKVVDGVPTPTMSTLLDRLANAAIERANSARTKPHVLSRPGSINSKRTYVIRRVALVFKEHYGDYLQRTLASFAEAVLGADAEVTVEQVNSALQNWKPPAYNARGEYL